MFDARRIKLICLVCIGHHEHGGAFYCEVFQVTMGHWALEYPDWERTEKQCFGERLLHQSNDSPTTNETNKEHPTYRFSLVILTNPVTQLNPGA